MRNFFLVIVLLLVGISIAFYTYTVIQREKINNASILDPIANLEKIKDSISSFTQSQLSAKKSELENSDTISILLLGIDRRSKLEYSYRTDTMVNVLINKETNRVVLISVPRDLWYVDGRINDEYIQNGWEGIAQAFYEITGVMPSRYILTDFEDFTWLVDGMGGVDVEIENTFTDTSYPVDATLGYQTVTFIQGHEKLTGDRALIFSRSRKGNNGEGSDWMRMKRQHLILKGMLNSIERPENLFTPMNVENALKLVTTGRMDTNIVLNDAEYLWDMYKDRAKYEISSLILNDDYVFNPPMSEYGGAWVLAPLDSTYSSFHFKVSEVLSNLPVTEPDAVQIESPTVD